MQPYADHHLSERKIIREFSHDVNSNELEWHMDRFDRQVTVLEGKGWKLQLEQGLPFNLIEGKTYSIPRESWHRVIKGESSLRIAIDEK